MRVGASFNRGAEQDDGAGAALGETATTSEVCGAYVFETRPYPVKGVSLSSLNLCGREDLDP